MKNYDVDLLIRNGTVVAPSGRMAADVAVDGERVVAIGPSLMQRAARTIDAQGCFVLPGFVDPHVHMSLPVGEGLVSSDDFASGSIAAACGGTTTIIDFTTQARGTGLEQGVAERRAQADGALAIDYSLHVTVMDAGERTRRAIEQLAEQGYASIKVYMTYAGLMVNDDELVRILDTAAGCGVITLVHAENHQIVTLLTQRLLDAGQRAPAAHPLARPSWAESEAVGRAIALAGAAGASLYIVHVSCRESLQHIAHARSLGLAVSAETCPQYLLLCDEEYARSGFNGARYVMTPPLRDRANWPALWSALADGTLSVVGSDHCPWWFSTQKVRGLERFDRIPGGVAGVETRGPLILSDVDKPGGLTLERAVDVLATGPARLFGLYPRKGVVATGSDADLVIFDPARPGTVRQAGLHHNVDYTVFEGQGAGKIVMTISRGRVVARDGEFTGVVGHGRFVPRRPTANRRSAQPQ